MEQAVITVIISIFLGRCTWTDIKRKEISIVYLLVFGLAGMVCVLFRSQMHILEAFAGMGLGLVLMGISKITKGGIGLGDGGVLCVTGLYLGFGENLEIFFMGLLFAALASTYLIVVKKIGRKTQIPFIPFLTAGFLCVKIVPLFR